MTWYREWFGEEYLELYAHRDEQEARRQVGFFRERFGDVGGVILDLACGTGRHLTELNGEGFTAVGCDLSFTLLRTGIDEYGPLPVARADMRALPFCSNSFGGLVNFFTSFGYFATEEENLDVVREMARVLRPGGVFLFDYLNVDRELDGLVERESLDTPRGRVEIDRWFDPRDRSFNKRITIGQKRFLERVRGYDLNEISMMFNSSGLSIDQAFGDFQGAPFDAASPRLILVGSRTR
ncbi:MAG TPA: class I SAM-dependent methyltransferase [Thermoanaerobaculia bacterium]